MDCYVTGGDSFELHNIWCVPKSHNFSYSTKKKCFDNRETGLTSTEKESFQLTVLWFGIRVTLRTVSEGDKLGWKISRFGFVVVSLVDFSFSLCYLILKLCDLTALLLFEICLLSCSRINSSLFWQFDSFSRTRSLKLDQVTSKIPNKSENSF